MASPVIDPELRRLRHDVRGGLDALRLGLARARAAGAAGGPEFFDLVERQVARLAERVSTVQPDPVAIGSTGHGPSTVLLVEDDPHQARATGEILLSAAPGEFRVDHAVRWSDAASALVARQFDVVLLDLYLPDGQGLEALRRAVALAPATPVVVLTSVSDLETGVAAVRDGAQDLLVKGRFEPDTLVRALRYAIERARLRAERDRLNGALREALATVTQLHGLLPICAWCKRIRDERGRWHSLEQYVAERSGVAFSHGVCAECATGLMAPDDA